TRWPRDWSSDVCSSDLTDARVVAARLRLRPEVSGAELALVVEERSREIDDGRFHLVDLPASAVLAFLDRIREHVSGGQVVRRIRSEERRVGKGCGCRWD